MEIKYIILTTLCALCTSAANITDGKQSKRGTPELSYSYAATDIGAKGGTHIKTITIIKNYGHKEKTLKINPELHKDENWGSKFRDNFDSYGKIPEIPDVIHSDFYKKEDKSVKKEKTKTEIPIFEEIDEEKNSEDQDQNNAEAKDTSENENENNENLEDQEGALEESDKIKEDVEVIETKAENNKKDDMNMKSQQLISILPNASKPQRYVQSASILNTRPYHQILKTYINPQASASLSYKMPENFKLTYSPLIFPPIPVQPTIKPTTQISKGKIQIGKSQAFSTTQLPYVAPHIKRSQGSSTTTTAPEETFDAIYAKTKTKPALPSRTRGLRY